MAAARRANKEKGELSMNTSTRRVPQPLVDGLQAAIERETRIRAAAAGAAEAWLREVMASRRLAERLAQLRIPEPTNDAPPFYETLAYALASDTLMSLRFGEYVSIRRFRYWNSDQERRDIAQTSEEIWSLASEAGPEIARLWYHHILDNSPDRRANRPPPLRLIEQFANYETRCVDSLGPMSGLLLSGPFSSHFILAHRSAQSEQKLVETHLLAHLLLSHVNPNRYSLWREFRPGKAPASLANDPYYQRVETEADDVAVCLLTHFDRNLKLTHGGRLLLRQLIRRSVPTAIIRQLLRVRRILNKPLYSLLQATALEPGSLVRGEDRHVYLIGTDMKKHWICSKLILEADVTRQNLADLKIRPVPERLLAPIENGEWILTSEAMSTYVR